jgi:hypothetical protein
MRTGPSLIAAAALIPFQGPAAAQTDREGPALVYRSPDGCPSAESFMQRLRARLGPSWTAATAAGGRRTLNVRIVAANRLYSGRLSLIEPDGRSMTKSLEGHDCEALVDALSLVASLAVASDSAADAGATPAPATAASPASTATPASTALPASTASPASNESLDRPATSSPPLDRVDGPDRPDRLDRAGAKAPGSRVGLEIGGLVAVGPAPAPVYGGTLSFVWASLGEGWFCPAFQLGAVAALAPDLAETAGTARFTWLTVRGAVYLVRGTLGQGVALRAGVIGDAGALLARGLETLSPADSSRGWLSLGVAASLEVPLGSRLSVRPVLDVEAPVRRDRYAFGSTDFFEVPVAVATGAASIVAYF